MDADMKKWATDYAKAQDRDLGEIVEGMFRKLKDENEPNSEELEERRLQHQLEDVMKTLDDLEDKNNKKYMESRELAAALNDAYPELRHDWRLIRVRALTDFRENPDSPWIKEFKVKTPLEILAACQIAMDLNKLRESCKILTAELETKLGVKLDVQPAAEKQEPINQPAREAEESETPGPGPPLNTKDPERNEDDTWSGDDESSADEESEEP